MRGLLVRLFGFGSTQLRRAGALLGYGALGAMRHRELVEAIGRGWERYGPYGAATPPVLAEWEADFYGRHLEPGGRILLVGCGPGRDLIALAERGHAVDGLDIAAQALAQCRAEVQRRGLPSRLYEGAVEETRFETTYDAAVFTWLAYGFIPGAAARTRTLEALRAVLRPAGRILLTYTTRVPERSRIPAALAAVAARVTGSDWIPQHGDSVELMTADANGRRAIYFEHAFLPDEAVREAHAAGLRVLSHEQVHEGRLVLVRD